MNHYVALTGSPDGWNIAYYIFTFFRGILFFTVIVLIGTGWSYMKVRTARCAADQRARRCLRLCPVNTFGLVFKHLSHLVVCARLP